MPKQPVFTKCDLCTDVHNVFIRRKFNNEYINRYLCYDCFYAYQDAERAAAQLKSLKSLVNALRDHAYNYTFTDGSLVADLRQAANYLEAIAERN